MRPLLTAVLIPLLALVAHAAPGRDAKTTPAELYQHVLQKADLIRPQLRALDQQRRDHLFDLVSRHPVAGLSSLDRYDPDGVIGFCFGRAMTAHLMARRMGLAPASVAKLFVVGDLRQAGATQTEWRFHVTTIVRGDEGEREWFAIDPIMDGVLTVKEWVRTVIRTWDRPRKARFYLVPASSVIPDLSTVPPVDRETGERLIELSFDPAGKPGFTARQDVAPTGFEANLDAARTYFMDAEEPVAPFDLTQLTINGQGFSYRNYFAELLADLDRSTIDDMQPPSLKMAARTAQARVRASRLLPTASRRKAAGLGSPDFGRLIRKTGRR